MSTDLKDRDTGVNPADSHFDDLFNRKRSAEDLSELEGRSTQQSADEGGDNRDIQSQEKQGGWSNNVSQGNAVDQMAGAAEKIGGTKGKIAAKGIRAANNMFGPGAAIAIAAILLLVLVIGTGSIMPLQVVELFTNEFNDSSAFTRVKSSRIIGTRINRDMNVGSLCQTVSIRCKFNTFSDGQIELYRKAGFEVETSSKGVLGRNKIDALTLIKTDIGPNGSPIETKLTARNSKEFHRLARDNPEFRTAASKVYNPASQGFFW